MLSGGWGRGRSLFRCQQVTSSSVAIGGENWQIFHDGKIKLLLLPVASSHILYNRFNSRSFEPKIHLDSSVNLSVIELIKPLSSPPA